MVGVRAGAHLRARALPRRACQAARRHRRGAAEGVPARQPQRTRARRGLLRLARGGGASTRVVARAQAGARLPGPAHADGRGARAGQGARRSGPRAARGLPARAPGARRRAAVARAQGVLPRSRRTDGRRAACAARARVRAQRTGHAGATRGRRGALAGRLRGEPRPTPEDRLRARYGMAGAARAGGAPGERAVPGRPCRADVRARREPALRRGPLAERQVPAERAGGADRQASHPGRRSDRAGRVRWRAGRLRSRLRANAGGEGPARLPAGLQQAAAAAGDARDSGRGRRRGGAGGAGGDVQARVWRGPPAPAAGRSAAAVPAAHAGPADARIRVRRHAHRRAGGCDDADRRARGRLAQGLLPRTHAVRLPAAREVQPARGLGKRRQRDDPQRRRTRLGQDHARAEARIRGLSAGRTRGRLRSEGRPSLPPPQRCRRPRRARHAAPGPGAARHARSAAGRARPPAPGRGGLVPAGPAPGKGRPRVGDGGGGRGRPRAHALLASPPAARWSGRSNRAGRPTSRLAGRSTCTRAQG